MNLLTGEQRDHLLKNGAASAAGEGGDFPPVVKLFTPDAGATWLLSEIDPDDPDTAFGLCDLGLGFPEIGSVSLSEIAAVRGKLRLPVERDGSFKGDKPLSEYARLPRAEGAIFA